MTETVSSMRIETPKNLDNIFSLECFKYLEMKGLFKEIYAYLMTVDGRFAQMEQKLNSIPNFDGLAKSIKDLENRLREDERLIERNKI